MDHKLSDPAHLLPFIDPATSERVTGKAAVDRHFGVRASGVIGQVFGSKSLFTEAHVSALISFLSRGKARKM